MAMRLRPTFTMVCDQPCVNVTRLLRSALEQTSLEVKWARVPGARAEDVSVGAFVWVAPPPAVQRVFSPWLQLSITPSGAAQTNLFGRFSPRPAVWSAFAFSYLFLACVAFFSCMLGLALLMVREPPWSFWVTAAAMVLIAVMVWISVVGQRLAAEQMDTIRSAVESALTRSARA